MIAESNLPYDPHAYPRELKRHYISASEADIEGMLETVGAERLADLYAHIPAESRFAEAPELPEELSYEDLRTHVEALAARNHVRPSFIGDSLHAYTVPEIVSFVSNLRNLTTAYTPYQPERSQGTLLSHWIYQCAMGQLTGFDAINSSLYERSTAIFEAICTALRLSRQGKSVILSEALFPGDLEVVETLARHTDIELLFAPIDASTGRTDLAALKELAAAQPAGHLAAVIFPQVNKLGLLEDVHALTDAIHALGSKAIAVIDPFLLATGGLVPPMGFGAKGADMIVGEAQHLAIGPNFGGPGLGLFGVRTDAAHRNDVRQTPGRYIGKAVDDDGRECCVMVLSTREQHIRKDKATSNICSNQAFLATIAGASMLARGEAGMAAAIRRGFTQARAAAERLLALPGLRLAFPEAACFNEIVFELPEPAAEAITAAAANGLHLGVDVSERIPGNRFLLKLTFTDIEADIEALVAFFTARSYAGAPAGGGLTEIPEALLRQGSAQLPGFDEATLRRYYSDLAALNVSPDDACYPLGSCTMKYNPLINDYAAGLAGFTDIHPLAPEADTQGSLEVLFEIQEWFKKITGLPGVTTQPVAGAQGELVGIKLFQAYHAERGEGHRDVIFIPASAHGTNFATAIMAGYKTRRVDGRQAGIVLLQSDKDGLIDMADFEAKMAEYGPHLAGIMVTNPNTCGLFETRFREIAAQVHAAGGLVYMDGANMNAIAGWCDLGAMGVDAVHNNLHKTWTIPHGGGGPGDAIVAVSERLVDYLPGKQIRREGDRFVSFTPPKSIGSFHRHWGNFAHKVRAYTYLRRLGRAGVPRMTALAVLSARYCYARLKKSFPTLPAGADSQPRMHEFILTLTKEDFARLEKVGIPPNLAVGRIGKLFLDFGFHAPTVAWPEALGLMIEPTETYSRAELDRFCEAVEAIADVIRTEPESLRVVPLFTPVARIDDVAANRQPQFRETLSELPPVHPNRLSPAEIARLPVAEIRQRIREAASLLPV
jgi:glycine dehydrogenase